MNAFVAGCDAIRTAFPNATVLVIHHQGKKLKSGDRGRTALRGAADTVMHLNVKDGVTFLECEKEKDAEKVGTIKMTPKLVDFVGGSLVVLEPGEGDYRPSACERRRGGVLAKRDAGDFACGFRDLPASA
jgi:hypothetical protein